MPWQVKWRFHHFSFNLFLSQSNSALSTTPKNKIFLAGNPHTTIVHNNILYEEERQAEAIKKFSNLPRMEEKATYFWICIHFWLTPSITIMCHIRTIASYRVFWLKKDITKGLFIFVTQRFSVSRWGCHTRDASYINEIVKATTQKKDFFTLIYRR